MVSKTRENDERDNIVGPECETAETTRNVAATLYGATPRTIALLKYNFLPKYGVHLIVAQVAPFETFHHLDNIRMNTSRGVNKN